MGELQSFVNECGEEMEVNSTPRKERITTPVKEKMTTPVKEKSVPIVESQLSAKKRSLHMTELEEGTAKSVCREEKDDSVLVTRKHRTIAFSDSE